MLKLEYNIYCDESCHLQNDSSNVMTLGAIWCPSSKRKEIFDRIREIKQKHGFSSDFEIKWNKVSPAGINFYMDIVNYFFDDDDLHFRALIVPNKKELNHDYFNQNHDTFYYKMYLDLLKVILNPEFSYNIYLDIKDTRSQEKVTKLKDILRNNQYDFQKQIVKKVQQVNSQEIEILQLTDILIGAVTYLHRGLNTSSAKLELINRIKKRSGYSLYQSTLYKENKFNLFLWKSRII
jgi:hypothetical protein